VESILGAHARLLRERGHDVRVIAGRGDAEIVPEVDSRHPEVERLYRALGRGEVDEAAFARLTGVLRGRLRPLLADRDVVVAHNVMTMPFNLALAAALAGGGVPVLAWTHDLAWTNPRYREYRRPGPVYDVLHTAQPGVTYVAISRLRQAEIARTLDVPAARVPVVPNGVDAAAFLGLGASTRALLDAAGARGTWPLVLVPVRITRRKRIELAIEAAALLRPRHPGLRLVVSGPLGPHNADNRRYAAELARRRDELGLGDVTCFLYGLAGPDGRHPVDDVAIAELYRAADCVVLPSESEGFGLPALEAALARAPMVAADIEVMREVAGAGLHYFPADGDATDVAGAIERALASRPSRLRRRALSRHDWPAVVDQMESLIEDSTWRRSPDS
jgi:glycosyltransferase involved in cell wall biosynthesis